MFMIFFVLHDPCQLSGILEAWEKAGVKGITILPSTGLRRLQSKDMLREDMPLIPSLEDLLEHEERLNRTLFTIVEGDEMVEKVVAATQSITGDLSLPNTGILTVLPVARVYGLDHNKLADEEIG